MVRLNLQVGICSALVGVQFVGALLWLIIDPPETIFIYPDRLTAVLSCKVGLSEDI